MKDGCSSMVEVPAKTFAAIRRADQRYYSPGTGRFLTADPYLPSAGAENPSSWNRYAYVEGDPINRLDPSGLDYVTANFNPGDPRNVTSGHNSVTVTASGVPTGLSDFMADAQRYYGAPLSGGPGLGQSYPGGFSEMLGRQNSAQMEQQSTVLYPVGNPQPSLLPPFTMPGQNYCGPGSKSEQTLGGTTPATPTNSLDQACQQHDACYEGAGIAAADAFINSVLGIGMTPEQIQGQRACDRALCTEAKNNLPANSTEAGNAFIVQVYFQCP